MKRYQRVICGLLDIVDGLVVVVTLGSYYTNFAFNYTANTAIKNLKNKGK